MQPPKSEQPEQGPHKRPRRFVVRVACDSIKEAALIERGLRDPEIVALVKVMGALEALPTRETKVLALDLVERMLSHRDKTKDKEPF